jgi:hypothetical protein
MDLLAGRPCAIEALSGKLDCEKAQQQGGDCNVPELPIPSPLLQPVCGQVWTEPGQTPGQLGVLGIVAPEQTHGASSRSLPPTPNHGGGGGPQG